jgi:hypothetical protein
VVAVAQPGSEVVAEPGGLSGVKMRVSSNRAWVRVAAGAGVPTSNGVATATVRAVTARVLLMVMPFVRPPPATSKLPGARRRE